MKSFYLGHEVRSGVTAFAHKLCRALSLPEVTIRWVEWTTTAGINSHGDMILANIADDARVSRIEFEKYCGFVAHELCHHKYTDFNVHSDIQYIDQLHNAVEDAWIEHNAIASGLTGNIDFLFSQLVEVMVGVSMQEVEDWNNPEVFPFALAVYLRNHAKTKVPFPHAFIPVFETAKEMLAKCKNSTDTLAVAVYVFDQLKKKTKRPKPQEGEGNKEGEQEGTKKGTKKAKKADKNPEEGQTKGEGDSPADGDSEGSEGDQGDKGNKGDQGKGDQGQGDEGQGEDGGHGSAEVTEDSVAREVEPTCSAPEGTGGVGNYDGAGALRPVDRFLDYEKFEVKVNVPAKLRYTIRRLFEDSGLEEHQRNRKAGSINVHAIHKIGYTDRLFKRRLEVEGIDSAVVVCLDVSSSMFDDVRNMGRIRSAIKTTYALLETMDRAGVATCVLAFGDRFCVLKPWNANVIKTSKVLASLRSGGGTNDYDAVRYAHEMLLTRPEVRKICFAITDGIGNTRAVRAQCEAGERLGITTVGVGIGMSVDNAYPQNVTVHDLEQLGSTSFEKIKLVA